MGVFPWTNTQLHEFLGHWCCWIRGTSKWLRDPKLHWNLMYPHVVLRHVIRHIIGSNTVRCCFLASLRWWNWHKQFPWELRLNQHTNTQIKPSTYMCIIWKYFTHRNIFKTCRSLEIFTDLPLQPKRNFGQTSTISRLETTRLRCDTFSSPVIPIFCPLGP